MQPILAESVPHRGRAVVLGATLAVVAALLLPFTARSPRIDHNRPRHCHCHCAHAGQAAHEWR